MRLPAPSAAVCRAQTRYAADEWRAYLTSNPLDDGTYGVFADAEDLAGNVSGPSATLKTTIANQSLSLPLPTFGAPGSPVAVDLAAGTVSGYS